HDAREAQIRRRMAKQAPPIIGALGTVGVTFTAGGSDGVSSLGLDKLTCSGCGLWFTGEFAADAETMRNQLRELHIELDGAVGCLGRLADDG
ncbi:MAG TPA: hypothetical protein VFH61_18420, partial [Thermoleophilia bacterium]|nr:hypothetical protein [Thermoleophilia bacterium]